MILAASFLEIGISVLSFGCGGGQKVPAGANLESECICGFFGKRWSWMRIPHGVTMKIKYGFILFAATLLAGCAGFWKLPASTTTTTTTTTTTESSGVFYVLN